MTGHGESHFLLSEASTPCFFWHRTSLWTGHHSSAHPRVRRPAKKTKWNGSLSRLPQFALDYARDRRNHTKSTG